MLPNFESYIVEEEEGSGIKALITSWCLHHISGDHFLLYGFLIVFV